jgi:integrase
VPLCKRALELAGMGDGAYLFPGQTARSIDSMAMRRMLQRLGYGHVSVHGTARSSFRDFVAERTNFPNHVVEMALGHAIPSAVEAAYRRGDLFDKRRALMDAWAQYCASPPAKSAGKVVVPLRSA